MAWGGTRALWVVWLLLPYWWQLLGPCPSVYLFMLRVPVLLGRLSHTQAHPNPSLSVHPSQTFGVPLSRMLNIGRCAQTSTKECSLFWGTDKK